MATGTENLLSLVRQLIVEKDRVICEKDELIDSRDRLWISMHQIIQEKDARIAELTARGAPKTEDIELVAQIKNLGEENRHLRQRTDELEKALRETLIDDTSDQEVDEDEEPGELGERTRFDHNGSVYRADKLALITPETSQDQDMLMMPTKPTASVRFEYLMVDSLPSTRFYIRPLIDSSINNLPVFGQLQELAPNLLQAIQTTLNGMQHSPSLHNAARVGTRQCGWQQTHDGCSRWTVKQPRSFCCKTCFNKHRPCLVGVGKGVWHLLPVPPEARPADASWTDGAYYIYDGTATSMSFAGVWEAEKWKGKGRAKRQRLDVEDHDGEKDRNLETVHQDVAAAPAEGYEDEDEANLRLLLQSLE